MSYVTSLKVVRLFLAISVSVWLAGGCLFGCASTAMASTSSVDEAASVEGDSCHSKRTHDCCSKPKPEPKPAKQSTVGALKLAQTITSTTLSSLPQGMMGDCPLVISSTAITSKSNSNSPDPAQATNATLPVIENSDVVVQRQVVAPYLPNRGPTYLRCCAFLI
ncbi:MAG TPA: hypothetical protein VFS77_21635 [Pyrinomonadaceae bacterium]|nr:hypothetical protein [Pyrinomonadaceae bacterium]